MLALATRFTLGAGNWDSGLVGKRTGGSSIPTHPARIARLSHPSQRIHIDGTGRLQSVERGSRFHALLAAFQARTGVPMVVNTSFNVMGESIVETPDDALWCMLSTGIDFCVLEDRLVRKRAGFRSLLELVPRVVARRCTIDLALADGQLGSTPGPGLRALVATPRGHVEQVVTADFLPLLQHMNGQRTGHDILVGLDGTLGDSELLRALSVLRQLRIIELGASREPSVSAG